MLHGIVNNKYLYGACLCTYFSNHSLMIRCRIIVHIKVDWLIIIQYTDTVATNWLMT